MDSKLTYAMFAVVLAVALGAYLFPAAKTQFISGATPAGGYNVSPFAQSIVANLATPGANGTSTSILNTSPNDYYVTGVNIACEGIGSSNTAYSGAGLATLTVFAATSSTAAPAGSTFNANKIGGGNFTISTSSVQFVNASTTANNGTNTPLNIWGAGTYLTFFTNATNTAACSFGVNVISA